LAFNNFLTKTNLIMKILVKVLGVIAVLVALLLASLGIIRNFGDASDASTPEYTQQMEQAKEMMNQVSGLVGEENMEAVGEEMNKAKALMENMPSAGTFTMLGVLNIVMLLIALVSGVLLFVMRPKIAMMCLAGSIIVFAVIYFMSPDLDLGPYGPASPKTIALMVGIPVVISAAFAFIANKQGAQTA
jgi:uncharacterized membrane protein YedE/YeeE